MAVGVITEPEGEYTSSPVSAFYCTTSGIAFGPVFDGGKDSVCGFQIWMQEKGLPDPRVMEASDLSLEWSHWEDLSYDEQNKYIP